ncbi:Uncharacterised protein [Listeria fleischmannii subsp. fleischmannii]|uniref:Uncharacterized protein n=1 Tax=Listeria fleischmannii subsp. fleischmannii TaxID=1671902 RepID=A0A2X3GY93_9LIST|nr:Uncharacterised protein [Listeria fleischmannii subsp. fleischmannii]
MKTLTQVLKSKRAQAEPIIVPYIMAGDGDLKRSVKPFLFWKKTEYLPSKLVSLFPTQ